MMLMVALILVAALLAAVAGAYGGAWLVRSRLAEIEAWGTSDDGAARIDELGDGLDDVTRRIDIVERYGTTTDNQHIDIVWNRMEQVEASQKALVDQISAAVGINLNRGVSLWSERQADAP